MTTQEQGTIGFEELKVDALNLIVGAASPEEQAVAVAAYNKIILDEAEAGVKAEKSRRADARASQAANSTVIERRRRSWLRQSRIWWGRLSCPAWV